MVKEGSEIEIWGYGHQTRSFPFVDECMDATGRLTESEFQKALNIGAEEVVTINQLATMTMKIAGKELAIRHLRGPVGVCGTNSGNAMIRVEPGWAPLRRLAEGLAKSYQWIAEQVAANTTDGMSEPSLSGANKAS